MLVLKVDKSKLSSSLSLAWLISTIFVLHYGFIKLPFAYLTQLQIAWFLLSVLVLIPLYARYICRQIFHLWYLRYVTLLMLFPFIYGVIGHREMGQSTFMGIVGGRSYFWLFVLVMLVIYTRQGRLSGVQLVNGFKFLAWFCLVVYMLVILFADLSVSKMYDSGVVRGARLRFDATFIVFGLMYYFVQFGTQKNIVKNLLCCLPFAIFLLQYLQSRSVLLAVGCSIAVVTFSVFDARSKVRFVLIGCGLFVVSFGYFFFIDPDHPLVLLFSYLLNVLLYGYSEGSSANHRAWEMIIALKSIEMRPWFGVGMISSSADNFSDMFGRVNESDIGIVGTIMKFGYVGTVVLYLQFIPVWWFMIKSSIKGVSPEHRAGLQVIILMNIYMFFMCLFTATIAFAPLVVMIFNCVLLMVYLPMVKQKM